MRKLIIASFVGTLLMTPIAADPALADCGFLNCVGKAIGLGGITQPLDNLNREIKNRSSDASVYNQIMGGYNNPFRAAGGAGPPLPVQLGNFCTVPGAGRFGPGPVNPLGAPCNVNGPYGPMFGQVTL